MDQRLASPLRIQVTAVRREVDRRHVALAEASNVMEALASEPWDRLTPDQAGMRELSPHARAMLPAGTLRVDIIGDLDGLPSKRLDVEVRWLAQPGRPVAKVRFSSWVYQNGEEKK